ncbi:MAG: outer membrane protein assembly factor BamB family protein [Actinomycetota bacterium]
MRSRLAMLLIATTFIPLGAAHASVAGCATTPSGGGDWPVYGHDDSNTRTQSQEQHISASNVSNLTAKWVFSSSGSGGTGSIDGTPTEADGCVFVATETGSIFALNADTGALVWRTQVGPGGVFSSVTVADGKVFANESITSAPYEVGPRVTALDESTGRQLWETVVNDFPGSDLYASPTVHNGMVITGIGANSVEGDPEFHGSVVFLDELTGSIIKRTWTIPPELWNEGYSGGGVWGTLAFDANGYGYTGTGNPFNSAREYGTTNAIIKIDVDPTRPTFGQIVAAYKGLQDQYVASARQTCDAANALPPAAGTFARFVACEFLDLDFGSSVNLFVRSGRLVAGANQKGVYHLIDAQTMAPIWTAIDGLPLLLTGATSCAVDGGVIYGSENPPGWVYALSSDDGSRTWVAPHTGQNDIRHYEPTSVANGVVYQLDGNGILNVYRESDGTPLLIHPMTQDLGGTGTTMSTQSGGISIARNTVYAAGDQYLVAYKV